MTGRSTHRGASPLATDRQTRNNIYVYEIENINGIVYVGGALQQVVHRDSPDQPIDQPFIAAFDAASGDPVATFRPVLDHPVYAITEHPTTGAIIVGGEFTMVNGQPQTGLVALDPLTGATDTSYDVDIVLGGSWRATVWARLRRRLDLHRRRLRPSNRHQRRLQSIQPRQDRPPGRHRPNLGSRRQRRWRVDDSSDDRPTTPRLRRSFQPG
ncbi:MAG: hypothetical protein R2706_03555 [Acidimicrobiales bacterium]